MVDLNIGPACGSEEFYQWRPSWHAYPSLWSELPDPLVVNDFVANSNDTCRNNISVSVRSYEFTPAMNDWHRARLRTWGILSVASLVCIPGTLCHSGTTRSPRLAVRANSNGTYKNNISVMGTSHEFTPVKHSCDNRCWPAKLSHLVARLLWDGNLDPLANDKYRAQQNSHPPLIWETGSITLCACWSFWIAGGPCRAVTQR